MKTVLQILNGTLFFLKKIKIYPFFFQVTLFIIFCYLMLLLAAPPDLSSLNTGMLILWHVWWPLIPFLILLTGRLWCSVCPFSATAIVLNKLFPFRVLNNQFLMNNRIVLGLVVFVLIISVDNVFSIAVNQKYTFYFFLSFFAIMIVMAILFDYKTFCNAVCPFNLFAYLYRHFSFLKIEKKDALCSKCMHKEWVPSKPLNETGFNTHRKANHYENWRYTLECLKKCKSNAAHLKFMNPFGKKPPVDELKIIEALSPSIIIALFTTYVFLKSNYVANIFLRIQSYYSIHFDTFLFLAMTTALLAALLLNLFILVIAMNLLKIDRTIILKGFYCFVPMLILFHLSLALKDARGIVSLQHAYSFMGVLDPYIPKKNVMQVVSYTLVAAGILISAISLLRFSQHYLNSTINVASFFLFLCGAIFGLNSLLTITTIKYLQYFG